MQNNTDGARARISRLRERLILELPDTLVDAVGLGEGDEVELRAPTTRGFEVVRADQAAGALEGARRFRGRLPANFRFGTEDIEHRDPDLRR